MATPPVLVVMSLPAQESSGDLVFLGRWCRKWVTTRAFSVEPVVPAARSSPLFGENGIKRVFVSAASDAAAVCESLWKGKNSDGGLRRRRNYLQKSVKN